jgi:hypothetical protein
MSKDPAFLFYPNDYLGGTMGFNAEQHGLYILALIYQFNNGHFTEIQINSILNNKFELIKNKFKTDGLLYWNDRLDLEKEKRSKYCESRRDSIDKRWGKNDKPLSGKKINNIHTYIRNPIRMENENENRDCIINDLEKKEKEVQEKRKEKPLWQENTEEGFKEYLKISEPCFDIFLKDWNWIEIRKEYFPGCCVKRTLFRMWEEFWGTKAGWKNKRDAARGKPDYEMDWKATIERNFKKSICYYGKDEQDDEKTQIEIKKKFGEIK